MDIERSCLPDEKSLGHPYGIHQTSDTVEWACDPTSVTHQVHHHLQLYNRTQQHIQITYFIHTTVFFTENVTSHNSLPYLKTATLLIITAAASWSNPIAMCWTFDASTQFRAHVVTRTLRWPLECWYCVINCMQPRPPWGTGAVCWGFEIDNWWNFLFNSHRRKITSTVLDFKDWTVSCSNHTVEL